VYADLQGRIALVTGASRGIGAAAVRALAREGAHVVAVARNAAALQALEGAPGASAGQTTLLALDLADAHAVAELGATIRRRFGRLDVLVGNAAILGPVGSIAELSPADWQAVLATNVTANYLLMRACHDLLKSADAGRAVFMTSSVVGIARPGSAAYAASKGALELLVRTYANEVAQTRVRVNLFNPGPTRTAMHAARHPHVDLLTLATPVQVAERILPLCLPSFTENGKLYDFRYQRLLHYQPPA
jgi:NAD(P)-dependent dehydrogenase (short-subunit alcohol dehydrogenase family)